MSFFLGLSILSQLARARTGETPQIRKSLHCRATHHHSVWPPNPGEKETAFSVIHALANPQRADLPNGTSCPQALSLTKTDLSNALRPRETPPPWLAKRNLVRASARFNEKRSFRCPQPLRKTEPLTIQSFRWPVVSCEGKQYRISPTVRIRSSS